MVLSTGTFPYRIILTSVPGPDLGVVVSPEGVVILPVVHLHAAVHGDIQVGQVIRDVRVPRDITQHSLIVVVKPHCVPVSEIQYCSDVSRQGLSKNPSSLSLGQAVS